MYEIYLINKKTDEKKLIFGHTVKGAMTKNNLDPAEWVVELCEYMD